ncbi:phospholipase D-like domain-containing protein [Clostridium grantii]|uniref:SNF2 family N-terminal domain-containing protein n=1 Tax=Clostridium grantii DSM 8605 TaxID=1121316 RepID=A0A1M5Y610_9CLOT|nr:phospholipase D-like domain-containing protein [Clostridium grantii]SHI07487.1 SNF2 family N-terminal domain-containing protein [Clostridium grantii DSM 8605]
MESGILDNQNNGTVGEYLKENINDKSKLSIISAYFTIYAYKALKEKLDNIDSLKFLFGEPTFVTNNVINKRKSFCITKKESESEKDVERENFITDSSYDISLKEKLNQSSVARECVKWINEKVEIRSMIKPDFLHGKLYHIEQSNGVQKSVMGSSNFTVSGLGLGKEKNIELNLITDSNRDINDLKKWFDEIWKNKKLTEDVKDDVIKYIQQMYIENSPEFIYYVTLYNIFNEFLEWQEEENILQEQIGFTDTVIWRTLYDFQKDGVKGAINKISKHNGCIIADSVGLGKTFEALAVIKYFELKNKNVLVLYPKKLRDNWLV